ncbi:MAG: hypothetical protein OHK0038_19090 [Flammeovirgaceae bacterium]
MRQKVDKSINFFLEHKFFLKKMKKNITKHYKKCYKILYFDFYQYKNIKILLKKIKFEKYKRLLFCYFIEL